ncbi:mitochondrial ornithine carrier protein [Dispira parvispora]|uniref:Mitochondrial ornithine carrier protein n=1 Tax=Dispira parvispora TaxID=1520584 RepID=A0A9W8ASI7_9FUNG|nr:mitochondrial ornithine carrier protein [Dispira parvispora]
MSDLSAIVYGSIAGVTAKFVEYPFDTIKVRLQSQPANQQWFEGPWDCLRSTLRNEGLGGLYRGIASPIVGAMIENSALFYSYHWFQHMLQNALGDTRNVQSRHHNTSEVTLEDRLPLGHLTLAGALAGISAAFVLTPVELIKCRVQVQNIDMYGQRWSGSIPSVSSSAKQYTHQPRGTWATIGNIIRHEGMGAFFQGFTPTLIREAGGGAAWFGAYELVTGFFLHRRQTALVEQRNQKLLLDSAQSTTDVKLEPVVLGRKDLGPLELITAGACAGIAYNIVLYPVDVIKSQIQTTGELLDKRQAPLLTSTPTSTRQSIFRVLNRFQMWRIGSGLYQGGGIRALYRGCGITVARAAPSNAVLFVTYEYLSRFGDRLLGN